MSNLSSLLRLTSNKFYKSSFNLLEKNTLGAKVKSFGTTATVDKVSHIERENFAGLYILLTFPPNFAGAYILLAFQIPVGKFFKGGRIIYLFIY